ncbi:MAG: HDOD domain-containing protein [Sedimenticola sp.]|nr:HDOD domain-containing protein [Sedimenticola sp.]
MICISCGRTHRYIASSIDKGGMHWLRSDTATGLGICSFCDDSVDAWDQGARDVRTLAETKAGSPRQGDLPGWLIRNAKLPSLPHVLIEIYQELESETAGIERMIQLLETDPGLTTRALQLGNSAYYGSSRKVTQVADAILRVGPFDLWALLISTEVKSLFFGISPELIDMNSFWRHSLFTACACRKLAEARGLASPGDLFIAGLIHDIGKLLLLQQMPVEYSEIVHQHTFGDELCSLEEERLGINHAILGGRLLDSWSFPRKLVNLTITHHKVEDASEEVMLLRQADRLANFHLSGGPKGDSGSLQAEAVVAPIIALYDHLTELVL